jgi:hypothetical protein
MDAADVVRAAERACHRASKAPADETSQVMLLEALARLKATPLATFPEDVIDLVKRSRDAADALSDRILASNGLSDPSIRHELLAVCDTLGSLASAMRSSSGSTPTGDVK